MANGSTGLVIVGVVIGIVVAAQSDRVDFDRIDLPEARPIAAGSADGGTTNGSTGGSNGAGAAQPSGGSSGESPSSAGHGLDTPGVIRSVDGGRVVALTFSAGPDPTYTPQVLGILERHDVRATFCVTGEDVRSNQIVVQNIAAAGHTLCSQGDTQDFQLAQRDDVAMQQALRGALDAIEDAVPGASVPFFRAPGGGFSPELNQIAETYGHDPLGWSVDPRDWENPGARAIVEAVLDAVEPGSIVILHDGDGDRSDTVAALDPLIIELRNAGYEFVAP
jgi:peptidoglycan-N-acetylglucosamine deacetylase